MDQPEVGYVKTETVIVDPSEAAAVFRFAARPPDQIAPLAEWMAPELLEAWQVVARDLQTPDAISPSVQPSDWDDQESVASAAVWWPDGSGAGISVPRDQPLAERVVLLADQFQDHEVGALWSAGRPAVWPHCPGHPDSHPLRARVLDGVACWVCGDSTVIAAVGDLFAS